MKRRDFWKPVVAGALAPGALLAAAKAEAKPDDSPRWPPPSPQCVWLGRWQGPCAVYDLWACLGRYYTIRVPGLRLYAHYGPNALYTGWMIFPRDVARFEKFIACEYPQLGEAFRRAKAKGMMKDW